VSGIPLPPGLKESQKLEAPLPHPPTNQGRGRGPRLKFDFPAVVGEIGKKLAEEIRAVSLELYRQAAAMAEEEGVIHPLIRIRVRDGGGKKLILIDEAADPPTPRVFGPLEPATPLGELRGASDKQFSSGIICSPSLGTRTAGAHLPADVIQRTSEKYPKRMNVQEANWKPDAE